MRAQTAVSLLRCILLAAVVVPFVAGVHRPFLTGQLVYWHDSLVPLTQLHLFYDALVNGYAPLWSPEINAGEPLWTLVEMAPVLDPVAIAMWALTYAFGGHSVLAYQWTCVLWLLIFALGGLWCSRFVETDWWLNTLVFAVLFGGPIGLAMIAQSHGFLMPFRYLPFVIVAFLRLHASPSLGRALQLGIMTAVSAAGYQSVYALMFVGIFGTTYVWAHARIHPANRAPTGRHYAVAAAGAALGMLPTLVAGVELLRLVAVARITSPTRFYFLDRGVFARSLLAVTPLDLSPGVNPWHGSAYIGFLPAVLALFALAAVVVAAASRGKQPSPLELAWTIATLLSVVACLGLAGIHDYIQRHTTFLGLRNWGFLLTPVLLGFSQLAVVGFHRLVSISRSTPGEGRAGTGVAKRRDVSVTARRVGTAVALVLMATVAGEYLLVATTILASPVQDTFHLLPSLSTFRLICLLAALAVVRRTRLEGTAAGSAAGRSGAFAIHLVAVAGIALVVVALAAPSLPWIHGVATVATIVLTLALMKTLIERWDPGRAGAAQVSLVVLIVSLFYLYDFGQHGPRFSLKNDADHPLRVPTLGATASALEANRRWKFDVEAHVPFYFQGPSLIRRSFAVMDPVAPKPEEYGLWYTYNTHQTRLPRYHDLLGAGLPESVLKKILGVTAPIVRTVGAAAPASGKDEALGILAGAVDENALDRVAVVEGTVPDTLRVAGLDARPRTPRADRWVVDSFSPGRLVLSVTMEADGLLLYADNWSTGWTVAVDGERRELLIANVTTKAVYVPRGAHQVTFHYLPYLYVVTFWIRLGVVTGAPAAGGVVWLLARARSFRCLPGVSARPT